MISQVKLTVLFNEPFWIGVFELIEDDEYKVCKVTYGCEPRVDETLDFILKRFYSLNFSSPISTEKSTSALKKLNPKRMQRKIQQETASKGIGTKAQIALKLQHEQCKVERKKKSKEQKELEKQIKFDLKQKKRLEKHKGH